MNPHPHPHQLTESPSSDSPILIRPSISHSPSSSSHRSILAIDLNQIPSPSETLPTPSSSSPAAFSHSLLSPTSLVRSFHDNPPLPVGPAAEIPTDSLSCPTCSSSVPDSALDRLVCDGCERGFHFHCAGVVASVAEEWICRDCLNDSVPSRRWRLGRTEDGNVMLLDMNASPPRDADGDAHSRKHCIRDAAAGGYTSRGFLSYPNFLCSGNGFGFHNASVVTHTAGMDFQDMLLNNRSTARSSEDIGYGSQLGKSRSNTVHRLPLLNASEVLQSLRDFVSERHGVLEEGWRVEFRQSKNGHETYAVYCAPDGKIFETMYDVASHLGLTSNDNCLEPDMRSNDGSAFRKNGLHLPKRRKLSKLPVGSGLMESKDNLTSGFSNGFPSKFQNVFLSASKSEKKSVATESENQEKEPPDAHHEGLPLQYEDFFVLSLGKIDARALYHDTCQISPVGYRSCWHDKITGSLFLCHVLDGGDSGPVFTVRRFSCSALPIPYGSTILQRRCGGHTDVPLKKDGNKLTTSDEDCSIEMILSDTCFPAESDSLPWLSNTPRAVDDQNTIHLETEGRSTHERSQDQPACHSSVGELIGEFSVDGNSPSLVWSILCQKVVDACRQIYKKSGSVKFFCKHAKEGLPSFYDIMKDTNEATFSSLDKYCSLLGSMKVPLTVTSDEEFDSTADALKGWLSSDRFGLDAGFVQELVEQFPDVNHCSRYRPLKRRRDVLKLPLVGNGLLLINGKSIELCQQDAVIDSLYKNYRLSWAPARVIHSRPPGKHFGVKLPSHLVGDVLQVQEILHRFHEILSVLPLKFDELEAELKSSWFESLSPLACDGESLGGQAMSVDGSGLLIEQTSSSSGEIDCTEENRFIEIQTAAMQKEEHAQLSMSIYCKCTGLRKAHMSLLDVLVSELQIKVAAMVDPSIDGESRSRRGRRRDVDSSILAIRPKLNLLPINELTWPELARRYIIAVLSMDGNPDSPETGIRECGKVFRCLQGDGGVLCGSLVGVAGIEADALLLTEATKQIYGCRSIENDELIFEDDDPESVSSSGMTGGGDGSIPEWALVLEPVRKLPTNVGTRIRKCIYEALEKNPPDWARKKLEHSISKEVYKGNASGPTKKAALSVLADAISEASQQKAVKEIKKKTILSISDIILRKCRILLRRSASADDEKMFCNLLGRNLVYSSENDDEGFLGSPAMVSRPLDFRTIDLRLAVGAYAGLHEAFLQDVRELWRNIAIAHAEQPELVQLAEKLSQNFESLYEEEVVALVGKLKEYSTMENMSSEIKKEIEDVLASTSVIPKAPWDEGVCKVCGIDKDDDSVLLCDTCDAEYHTYCLNPPLARIPEGNWYCPSCVSGVNMLASTSRGVQLNAQRHRRKNLGEGIRNHLEELARLSALMEQKDCWEFSVDERVSLLKFLCDEVLNSIVIRQHLEQCFETSADLQQKLRTLYSEWKSLKLREDMLAMKASKRVSGILNVVGDASLDGHIGKATNHNVCEEVNRFGGEKCEHNSSMSGSGPQAKSANQSETDILCESQVKQPVDLDCLVEDDGKAVKEDHAAVNHDLLERPLKRQKSNLLHECSVSNPVTRDTNSVETGSSCQDKLHEHDGQDVAVACKSEDGVSASSGHLNGFGTEAVSCSTSNELQASTDELKAVQNELSVLQQSIASAEAQIVKYLVRLEYLGTDSLSRLYWAAPQPDGRPWVIVDSTMAMQPREQGAGQATMIREGILFENSALGISDGHRSFGGSSVPCPFVYGRECSRPSPSPSQWVYYESEAEIRELVKSLNDYNPKERELKDSILHWQKLRFHGMHQAEKAQLLHSESTSAGRNVVPKLLVTKASTVLENKYGPFFLSQKVDVLKKQGKRSIETNDEKIYRCECLEPIWLSRQHCFSCHGTFYTVDELGKHNDGKCLPSSSVPKIVKVSNKPSRGLSERKSGKQHRLAVAAEKIQASQSTKPERSKNLKIQNGGSLCPYRFEDISSKFVTNDSIKELVYGIGLIGSEGVPSFVPSLSTYLGDPSLTVEEGTGVANDQLKISDKGVRQSDQIGGKCCIDNVADMSVRRLLRQKHEENLQSGEPLPQGHRDRSNKVASSSSTSLMVVDAYSSVPESSLKPLVGRAAQILKQLKICLLDMEAALPEESLRLVKVDQERRRAWRTFVKVAVTIFEMVQATIVLEDIIKTDYLKNEWWYWSSLSAAVRTSTLSSLALRIFALDNAIIYDGAVSDLTCTGSLKPSVDVDQHSPADLDSPERPKPGRRYSKRRREADG